MSKLDEKQVEQAHKSAAVQKDKAFEEWVSQSVLDETAEMVNGLENNPDLDDFEPSEELFQKIVGIANERGLLAEEETAEEETEGINVEKIELSEYKDKHILRSQTNLESKSKVVSQINYHSTRKRLVTKWVAMIAVTLLGIFGISMSSQANRPFVMQKVDEVFRGEDVNTKVNNTGNIVKSEEEESSDIDSIEDSLEIQLPVLLYLPDKMNYLGYEIDEEAQTAFLEYEYNSEIIHLIVFANYKEASGISKNDKGTKMDTIESEMLPLSAELFKVEDDGDIEPTYLLQWEYQNNFFEFIGKIEESEMREIFKNLFY